MVRTRNYEEGETITIVVDETDGQDINEQGKEITLTGVVDKNGFALLKEEVEFENSQKEEWEKLEKQQQEEERKSNEVYISYQGKDYTYNEWKIKEQELWEAY